MNLYQVKQFKDTFSNLFKKNEAAYSPDEKTINYFFIEIQKLGNALLEKKAKKKNEFDETQKRQATEPLSLYGYGEVTEQLTFLKKQLNEMDITSSQFWDFYQASFSLATQILKDNPNGLSPTSKAELALLTKCVVFNTGVLSKKELSADDLLEVEQIKTGLDNQFTSLQKLKNDLAPLEKKANWMNIIEVTGYCLMGAGAIVAIVGLLTFPVGLPAILIGLATIIVGAGLLTHALENELIIREKEKPIKLKIGLYEHHSRLLQEKKPAATTPNNFNTNRPQA